MSKRPRFYGDCYYCVCTACSGRSCPYKHLEFKYCQLCHERGKLPRYDCDFFQHYIKSRVFRFRPVTEKKPHSGTYILFTDNSVFVGSWDKLEPLRQRLGGTLKKMEFLDFIGGLDRDKH